MKPIIFQRTDVVTILLSLAFFVATFSVCAQNKIGINTSTPKYRLDIRGLHNTNDGGMLQLATPGETNFLRIFGGRLGDPHPFIAFTDTDTFHISSTSEDASTYAIRMTVLPSGQVGINDLVPSAMLEVNGDNDKAIIGRTSTGISIYGENESTTGYSVGIYGKSHSGVGGYGVYGENTSTTGSAYGVYGIAESGSGSGVKGINLAGTGDAIGVHGRTDSDSGYGVYGVHNRYFGAGYGVFGKSLSSSGYGVYGEGGYGVYGKSIYSGGYGVYALNTAVSGNAYGVYAKSESTSGIGVYGEGDTGLHGTSTGSGGYGVYGHNTYTGSNAAYGVYGQSEAYGGRGVYGLASAILGTNFGVYGRSNSTDGRGVFGLATAVSGFTYGVRGESQSVNGRGVYGKATSSSGSSYGVYGYADSAEGHGVHAGISGNTENAHAIHAVSGGGSSYAAYLDGKVRITGDLYVDNVPFGDRENLQYDFATGQVYFDNSSRRYKENIETLETDFSKILHARPVRYTRPGRPDRVEVGYIAEDMEQLGLDHLISYNREGQVENFNYEKMILYVVEVLKDQQALLDDQQVIIQNLQGELTELKDR